MCVVHDALDCMHVLLTRGRRLAQTVLFLFCFCFVSSPLCFADDDYELAMKRVRELLDVDPDVECTKPNSNDIVWGVVGAFLK